MKEGAYLGAIAAFFIYLMLPIYGDNGAPASILPTGNVVSDANSFNNYVSNLPLSTIIFFALEILGVSVGIAAQSVLRKAYAQKQAK
ncbi:hypothetical protein HYX06_03795 [Candidatus Woesearchaeota archaeon]|nr:hypothetical protein [Candidatus Woesearchaeota archaeon]